jgi:hypothetical protein
MWPIKYDRLASFFRSTGAISVRRPPSTVRDDQVSMIGWQDPHPHSNDMALSATGSVSDLLSTSVLDCNRDGYRILRLT